MRRKAREAGLTLVELLIAFALFVIAILAISRLFALGTGVNYQSRAKSAAVSFAKFKLEELKARPFTDPGLNAPGGALPPAAPVLNYSDYLGAEGQLLPSVTGAVYTRQWLVVVPDPINNPNLKQITVAVTLNGPVYGRQLSVQVTTYRARG